MRAVRIDDPESWRRFFADTGATVGVELALPWIQNKGELSGLIAQFVKSLLFALGTLGARVTPRHTRMHDDFAPRTVEPDAFLFSHHSIGDGDGICRFKHSYRRGYFSFDPLGYGGFSRLARDPASLEGAEAIPVPEAVDYAGRLRGQMVAANESKFAQPARTERPPRPGYVLLALQVPGDTVLRLSRSAPLDFYRRVIDETGKLGMRCVVKRHPKCTTPVVTELLSDAASLPHVEIRTDSVNDLLPGADRVVVVNSGVGLEALVHGRPTLTFGGCEYASLTSCIGSLDDVAAALAAPPRFDDVAVARFLLHYFEHCCVRADDDDGMLRKVSRILAGVPLRYGWDIAHDSDRLTPTASSASTEG
jgi:hypothetical protein